MHELDAAILNFDRTALTTLNVALAVIMFGVALGIRGDDFRRVAKVPRAMLMGLATQFVVLPALTFALIQVVRPEPSVALGMLLVAACPGGNISNFFTHLARGNAALSVSMSAVSTLAAVVMTPFNLAFWGGLDAGTAAILRSVDVDPLALVAVIALILALPLALGMGFVRLAPAAAERLRRPFQWASMAFFLLFVLGALAANFELFLTHVGAIAALVFVHNGLALAAGFLVSGAGGLHDYERRAVTIEVGIQNSGLGLVLIFDFFAGLGGMALITAWWGIWHIVSGAGVALVWRRRAPRLGATACN